MAHQLSSTIAKVLEILNDGAVHAGSDIAETLTISRTAVWKIIQRLKKYHVDVRSYHQGYQLNSPLILFDKKKIEGLFERPQITLEIFENIPSTSDYLKSKAPLKSTHFCLAESQSKGRGRLGRTWASPFGCNIYCSFHYVFNKDIGEMGGISLVIGLLIIKALEGFSPTLKPQLKWPNDIYLNNQKMGGVLIDLMAEANGNCTAIIGIGLNINMKDEGSKDIDQPWTSLEHVLNKKLDRNIVVAQLMQSIVSGVEVFHEKGLGPFLSEWQRYDLLQDQEVSITMGKHVISGIARGVDSHGYLLLELPSGNIEPFSYGDATLLKQPAS